jgi:hypothetical protein
MNNQLGNISYEEMKSINLDFVIKEQDKKEDELVNIITAIKISRVFLFRYAFNIVGKY